MGRKRPPRFRFYAELNDFLEEPDRFTTIERDFAVAPTVEEALGALGVPPAEVDLVVVNGESVHLSYVVRAGNLVSVYPVFESFDIAGTGKVRPEPLRVTRFVVDEGLRALAGSLRELGFDVVCTDGDVVRISREERRVLLTTDAAVLERRDTTHGYLVRAAGPAEQTTEVLARFHLESAERRARERRGLL